jgi:arylsulfatase A
MRCGGRSWSTAPFTASSTCLLLALSLMAPQPIGAQGASSRRGAHPNFVVFLMDDLGYGDLSSTGHPTIKTPNIDRMTREGMQLTSFYAAPVCTPARGMFLTGRYPPRTRLIWPTGPGETPGILPDELTVADVLRTLGYRTAMFGKWHLGDFDTNPAFNPTAHGFDVFSGIPYSHDYVPPAGVPLYRGTTMVERPVKYRTMTRRFTEEAIAFIRASAGHPFFVYLAQPMPHIPVGASEQFAGHSRAGRYGDTVEELDWSVGEVLTALRQLGLDSTTVAVFTSDNGPSALGAEVYDHKERGDKVIGDVGSAGLLRGLKGTTWEGGIRVPATIRWPGHIPPGTKSADIVSIMDLYPTFVSLADGAVPRDRIIDGVDVSTLLTGGRSARTEMLYYSGPTLEAIRQGKWKLQTAGRQSDTRRLDTWIQRDHVDSTGRVPGAAVPTPAEGRPAAEMIQELFDLDVDASERYNVAALHPEIVARLQARLSALNDTIQPRFQLVLANERAGARSLIEGHVPYRHPRLSPDGRRIAVEMGRGKRDIWIFEMSSHALTRLTTEGSNTMPEWTPDGSRVVFRSTRSGSTGVWWQVADGGASAQPLLNARVSSAVVAPNGQTLIYALSPAPGLGEIWARPIGGDTTRTLLVGRDSLVYAPRMSPDGRWLAYGAAGRVYVRRLGAASAAVSEPILVANGDTPVWSRDGTRLFYIHDDHILAATLSTAPSLHVTARESIDGYPGDYDTDHADFDVSMDGKEILRRRLHP